MVARVRIYIEHSGEKMKDVLTNIIRTITFNNGLYRFN